MKALLIAALVAVLPSAPAFAYYAVVEDKPDGSKRVVASHISLDQCLEMAERYGLWCEWNSTDE